ncbi:S41 family peptidase [Mariniflexile jejuense]|uniref:S41 family peptidase n=1 Tax=Mariniflexile jejuense TaxID=1173582 RepID=A0ABW3JLU5_9FLAO
MKKFLGFLLALILITSCSSVKKYNQQISMQHTVEALRSDVDNLYFQLKKNHPKLYQYTPKEQLDFKFDSLKKSINSPLTSREFYKKLAPVVANVKQGHIAVGSVIKRFTKKERKELRKFKQEFFDLDFEFLDEKLWVTNTRGEDSTLVGSEVVKIDNEHVSHLISTYKTRFASDGFNKTLYNRYVGKVFSRLHVKEHGYFDSLQVAFKQHDSLITKTFKQIEKNKKKDSISTNDTLKIAKPKLTKTEKKANRIANQNKRKYNKKHGLIKGDAYTRNFNFLEADSTVAYMKIESFSNGNYKKFYKESFATLDSAKTKNLILDLRDNGGGRIAEISYLYSFLTNDNYKLVEESEVKNRLPYFNFLMSNSSPTSLKIVSALVSPIIVAHNLIKTKKRDGSIYYKLRFSKEAKPNPLNYKGNMYVLINGNSFSASSLISTHLKATNRAVFVGEETGGAYNGCVAGIYKIYQLPNTKLKIRMGLMQIETPYKQMPDGFGIKPDVEITHTIEDVKTKTDPEIEWILKHINQNKN